MNRVTAGTIIGTVLAIALLALGEAVLRQNPAFLTSAVPDQQEVVELIARQEQIDSAAITLHELNKDTASPYVLYSMDSTPGVTYRALGHQRGRPWNWQIGGGSHVGPPDAGEMVSIGFRSGTDASGGGTTVIFGLVDSPAVAMDIRINGENYQKTVGESGAFLIIFEEPGLTPGHIQDFRLLDEHGNELAIPDWLLPPEQ